MRRLNNVCSFLGRLAKDPEMSKVGDKNTTKAKVLIAVDGPKRNGERKTTWVKGEVWGKQAEVLGEYFSKGSPIIATGHYVTNRYERDGETKYYEFFEFDSIGFVPAPSKKSQGSDDNTSQDVGDDDLPF